MLGEFDRSGYLQVGTGKGSKGAPAAVVVTTAATLILAANANRKAALIANNNPSGGQTLYLGRDNTVTAANGLPLAAGAVLGDVSSSDAWWGIVGSGTADARVLEVS